MKKMTIALLTAAAMGTSGFAVAQSGPDFSGRINYGVTDAEGSDADGSAANSKLAVSGGSNGIAGIETFYYARLTLDSGDASQDADTDGTANADYAYVGFSSDFGTFSAGRDDDLVYKLAGVRTDVYRETNPVGAFVYSEDYSRDENPSMQYSFDAGQVSIATYVDTGDSGFDRTQVGASVDLGAVSLGAVYADRDIDGYDEELHFGATADLGVASVRATIADGTTTPQASDGVATGNPYHIAAVVPLTEVFTATVGYGNNDAENDSDEVSDVAAMLMANLGGGVDVNASVLNGDSGDQVSAGIRYTF